MRHIIIFITFLFLGISFSAYLNKSHAATSKTEDKLVCVKTEDLNKIMNDKSFFHLLNMNNKNEVTETIWVSGTDIVITAQEKDTSCIIAMMKDVVYNPDTIEGLLKAYQNQAKKQKDI